MPHAVPAHMPSSPILPPTSKQDIADIVETIQNMVFTESTPPNSIPNSPCVTNAETLPFMHASSALLIMPPMRCHLDQMNPLPPSPVDWANDNVLSVDLPSFEPILELNTDTNDNKDCEDDSKQVEVHEQVKDIPRCTTMTNPNDQRIIRGHYWCRSPKY